MATGMGASFGIEPGPPLQACLAQHPPANWDYVAGLFRNRNEVFGEGDFPPRRVPANEGFGAGQCLGHQIDFALVMQFELALLQGVTQTAFKGLPLLSVLIHARLEELVVVAPTILRIQHRNVGVL